MVGISGLDTLPILKEIDPATPIAMVTKNEAESLMEEAIGKRIDDYLTKPVNPAQILALCKKYLESERIQSEKLTQNYLIGFNEISRKLLEVSSWEEWLEIYLKLVSWSTEIDRYHDIGFEQTFSDQFRECNAEFSKFVEKNYINWINNPQDTDVPILSPQIVDKHVLPIMKNGKTTIFFVVDCMRLDQWLVFEELLRPYYTFKKSYYCGILPTATVYARNSIFSGLYPIDIQKHYPQWWVGENNSDEHKQNAFEKELLEEQFSRKRIKLKNNINYIKIHDTDFGKKIESSITGYLKNQLTAIVINAVDMIAHSRSDYPILKEIAPNEAAYRTLTRSWFQHSSLFGMLRTLAEHDVNIILTTDHGSVRCMRGVKVIGDRDTSTNLRYKFGKNVKAEQRHSMQIKSLSDIKVPNMGISVNNIIAKEDYYFVYPSDYHFYLQRYRDSFQHGGISMEEMILPIVTLEKK